MGSRAPDRGPGRTPNNDCASFLRAARIRYLSAVAVPQGTARPLWRARPRQGCGCCPVAVSVCGKNAAADYSLAALVPERAPSAVLDKVAAEGCSPGQRPKLGGLGRGCGGCWGRWEGGLDVPVQCAHAEPLDSGRRLGPSIWAVDELRVVDIPHVKSGMASLRCGRCQSKVRRSECMLLTMTGYMVDAAE